MVSLNEKRSKIRYVVQNKTEWTEDGNKFGQRMLEKMGWKTGVGLGKNEDGRTEHIDMQFKANLKGVGFVNGKYDSTWIAHSQSYDSLLMQLQQSHPTASSSSLHNFQETVQQTKTRFNYKKQSSGKDLSSRTHHELDCIFGWNKGNQIKDEEAKEKEERDKEEAEEQESKDDTTTTSDNNLYTISKKSMHDYFKEKSRKKAQLLHEKSQSSNDEQIVKVDENASSESTPVQNEAMSDEVEVTESKSSSKTKREKSSDSIDEIEQVHKKKKSDQSDIKNPYEGSNLPDLDGYQGWNIDTPFDEILKKKEKRKKRKHHSEKRS